MPAPDPATSPTTTASGAHQPAETVVFAFRPRENLDKNKAYRTANGLAESVREFGFGIGVVFGAMILRHFTGLWVGFCVLVLMGLWIPLGLWRLIVYLRLRRACRHRLPLRPPEGSRLCCIGAPERLAEFGEWADVPFEPALFFGKFALRGRGWPRWLRVSIAILALVIGLSLGFLLLGRDISMFSFLWGGLAFAVPEAVTTFLWPTYLRLVPGRLDVLGYGPLSRNPIFVDRYDLRDATIMADLRRSFVSIVSKNGEPPRRLEFGISLMSERRKFVYMLFLAAMSSFEPGPVPEDGLLG